MSKASSRPTRGSFLRSLRKVSTFSMDQEERLATVRFLTLPFSRHPSRRRTAGGEFRLGTMFYVHGNAYGHVRSPRQRQTSQLHGNIFAMSPHHFVAKITCLGRFCCWSQGELRPSTRPISATPSSSTGSSRPETQFAMGREFADLMVPGYAPMRLVGPLPVWFTSRNTGSAPALPVSGPTQVHECSGPRGR